MPEGDLALAISSPAWMGSGVGGSGNVVNANTQCVSRNRPENIGRGEAARGLTYGQQPGQLAALPEGSHAEACERPAIAISSPPYIGTPVSAQGADGKSQEWNKAYREYRRTGDHAKFQAQMTEKCDKSGYGGEQGQLAQMPPGDHAAALEAGAETGQAQACISSPPYEASVNSGRDGIDFAKAGRPDKMVKTGAMHYPIGAGADRDFRYGSTAGQLGQETGSTFWAASREILEEVYRILAPGAHAIWVLKMFVRSGRLVDFPGQWEALCQSVGFRTVCKHRAWMNKDAGVVQTTLDGGEVSMEKWYKSFFRILCEKKGAPRIDWELVLCMEKPQ